MSNDEMKNKEDTIYELLETIHHLRLALDRKEREFMILEDDYIRLIRKHENALKKACKILKENTLCPFHDTGIELERCSVNCRNNEDGECWKEVLLNYE